MATLDALSLLDAWDSGALREEAELGPWLVDRLSLDPTGRDPSDLTVGGCDLLLVQLRETLFGSVLDVVSICPGCGSELESRIRTDDLWPDRAVGHQPTEGEFEVHAGGHDLRCRLPTNRDLLELSRLDVLARSAGLVERCVVGRVGDLGARNEFDASELGFDDEAVSVLATAMADRDPGIAVVELVCSCGAVREDEFDIRTFLWSELSVWAERTLTEIHYLATAYGWHETEILALSPRRRRAYLERCSW